ncbi:MAG: class IV adenylate cyclase [Candidatus Uhrbacteria bacterium]|nr:class IV adenylate cyclase [Candidatus Uhrbacteria bacterium]
MKEVEVKILEVNVDDVVAKLLALGAKKFFEGDMDVIYYDTASRSLKNQDYRLRLRTKGETNELTFKHKISKKGVKIEEELQVSVDNFEIMKEIMGRLDYAEVDSYKKHRLSYSLEGVLFEFDTIPGVPTLMEIEGKDEQAVFEWVEKLGFSRDDAKPWTGGDVLKYYKAL